MRLRLRLFWCDINVFLGEKKNEVFGFTFRVELTKYAIGACDNNWEGTDGSCLKGRSFSGSFDMYNRAHSCLYANKTASPQRSL